MIFQENEFLKTYNEIDKLWESFAEVDLLTEASYGSHIVDKVKNKFAGKSSTGYERIADPEKLKDVLAWCAQYFNEAVDPDASLAEQASGLGIDVADFIFMDRLKKSYEQLLSRSTSGFFMQADLVPSKLADISGIYCMINFDTKQQYIGKAVMMRQRLLTHYKHTPKDSPALHNAISFGGNWGWKVLQEVPVSDNLLEDLAAAEALHVGTLESESGSFYNLFDFNLCPGGIVGKVGVPAAKLAGPIIGLLSCRYTSLQHLQEITGTPKDYLTLLKSKLATNYIKQATSILNSCKSDYKLSYVEIVDRRELTLELDLREVFKEICTKLELDSSSDFTLTQFAERLENILKKGVDAVLPTTSTDTAKQNQINTIRTQLDLYKKATAYFVDKARGNTTLSGDAFIQANNFSISAATYNARRDKLMVYNCAETREATSLNYVLKLHKRELSNRNVIADLLHNIVKEANKDGLDVSTHLTDLADLAVRKVLTFDRKDLQLAIPIYKITSTLDDVLVLNYSDPTRGPAEKVVFVSLSPEELHAIEAAQIKLLREAFAKAINLIITENIEQVKDIPATLDLASTLIKTYLDWGFENEPGFALHASVNYGLNKKRIDNFIKALKVALDANSPRELNRGFLQKCPDKITPELWQQLVYD